MNTTAEKLNLTGTYEENIEFLNTLDVESVIAMSKELEELGMDAMATRASKITDGKTKSLFVRALNKYGSDVAMLCGLVVSRNKLSSKKVTLHTEHLSFREEVKVKYLDYVKTQLENTELDIVQ